MLVRRVLLSLIFVALLEYLFRIFRSRTRVLYCTTKPNETILKILAQLPDVHHRPSWIAAHPVLNMALYLLKVKWYKDRSVFRRESLTHTDGGSVAIDFLDHPTCNNLPVSAPIIIFLHTITGGAGDTAYFLHNAAKRGYRSVVLTRRGHGGVALTTPQFNIMGDADDTHRQILHLQKLYPNAWLGLVGLSAGSGLLVSYLGKYASSTPIKAACSLCPAYDISRAFGSMGSTLFGRVCESHILASMKDLFLRSNHELLNKHDAATFASCLQAPSMQEFINRHVPFALSSTNAGSKDAEKALADYMRVSNPMVWVDQIKTPLLVLNAEDDLVCLKANIREDLALNAPGVILVVCEHGSHLGFNEGLWGQNSFMTRLTLDFLDAAQKVV